MKSLRKDGMYELFPYKYTGRSFWKDEVKSAIKKNAPERHYRSTGMFSLGTTQIVEISDKKPLLNVIAKLKSHITENVEDYSAKLDLAICLWAVKELERSKDLLKECYRNNPEDVEIIEYLLRMLIFTRQTAEGLELARELNEMHKNDKEIAYLLGLLNYTEDHNNEALEYFRNAFQLDSTNETKWQTLVGLLGEMGKNEEIKKYTRPDGSDRPITINMGVRGRLVWDPTFTLYIPHFEDFKEELDYLLHYYLGDFKSIEDVDSLEVRQTSEREKVYLGMCTVVKFNEVLAQVEDGKTESLKESLSVLKSILANIVNQTGTLGDHHARLRFWLILLQNDFTHMLLSPDSYLMFSIQQICIEFPFSLVQTQEYMDRLSSINKQLSILSDRIMRKNVFTLESTLNRILERVTILISMLDLEIENSTLKGLDEHDIIEDSFMKPCESIECELFIKCLTKPFDLSDIIDYIKKQRGQCLPGVCEEEDEDEDDEDEYYRPDKIPDECDMAEDYVPGSYIQGLIKRKFLENIDRYTNDDFRKMVLSDIRFIQKMVLQEISPEKFEWQTVSTLFALDNYEILKTLITKFKQAFKEIDKKFLINLLVHVETRKDTMFGGLYDPDRDPEVEEAMYRSDGHFSYYGGTIVECRRFCFNKHNWLKYGSLLVDKRKELIKQIIKELEKEEEIMSIDIEVLWQNDFLKLTEEIERLNNYIE
ncbi:MAG: tetratricopeptide repeat protein [Candidatus Hodarchaeales archaeon]